VRKERLSDLWSAADGLLDGLDTYRKASRWMKA
jgi:hypothetical protein